jgi:Domain of unknown function (DUF4436)
MYLVHRNANYSTDFGAADAPDRVNVQVWIGHVDTTSQTMSVEIVDMEPTGALAGPDGSFTGDTVLTTSALGAPITIGRSTRRPRRYRPDVDAVDAGYYLLRWRRGLIFPACSMMAAMLFALIPLRNAVPGNPPIGSVIDFASFFIAETVIAVALIGSVVIGYRTEIANELAAGESVELEART